MEYYKAPARSRVKKEFAMQQTAVGPFDITLNPQPLSRATEKSGLGRLSLDKQFESPLVF